MDSSLTLYVLYHCGKMKSYIMTTKVLLYTVMYLSGRVSASGQEVKGTTPSCGLNLLGSKHRELARKRKKISRIVRLNIYIYLISLDFFFF